LKGAALAARGRAELSPAAVLLVTTALAVGAAYQITLPTTVDFAAPLPVPVSTRGFYPVEEGYRWTTGRGAIVLPGPGPGRPVRLDATVSAWRPRGTAAPRLRMSAGAATTLVQTTAAPSEASLITTTRPWHGDVELRLESGTFAPGPGDPRALGVRLHRVRLSAAGGAFAPGLPPLVPALWAASAAQLLFWIGVVLRRPSPSALRIALAGAGVAALGILLARGWTVRLLPGVAAAEAILLLLIAVMPEPVRAMGRRIAEVRRRIVLAARALKPAPLAALVLLSAAGTVLAYRMQPVLVLPMGSGREAAFESGLGTFDSVDGVRFRHLTSRAWVDLRDLGGGEWRVSVTAAAAGPPRAMPLFDVGTGVVEANVGPDWSAHEIAARAPTGWRSGLMITFPGSRREDIWLREVRVDRGRAWPPLRIVVAVAAAAILMAIAVLAAGLAPGAAWLAGAAVILLEVAALAVDPLAAIPCVRRLVAIAGAGALLTALVASVMAWTGREGSAPALPPAAIAAGGIGFTAWLAATTSPLYRGGHFVFHSSIAEEIWKGRFLLYYLPYPGSMLSQQAQWGNVVVPHPCLYHTLVAPLAALPRAAFFTGEKVLLALLLAAMVWASAALAARVGPPGAATAAAVLMASMPAAFQLLGLGHLMTIFGCWAMAMAVAYLALRADRMGERRTWWRAVLLLSLCFLAYFAGLLFMGMVVAIAVAAVFRKDQPLARALLTAAATAAAIAFAVYYVNWTAPFLSESVPRLLSGSGDHSSAAASALAPRLAAVPHKLAYTFGSSLLPLLGLSGLLLARRGVPRVLLLAWASVLPVFTGLDLFFNFLLKHHYFTMVPVAVGGGVLLGTLSERGRWGRAVAAVALIAVAVLGARAGLDAATGRIP
jgi:hypothetical protein